MLDQRTILHNEARDPKRHFSSHKLKTLIPVGHIQFVASVPCRRQEQKFSMSQVMQQCTQPLLWLLSIVMDTGIIFLLLQATRVQRPVRQDSGTFPCSHHTQGSSVPLPLSFPKPMDTRKHIFQTRSQYTLTGRESLAHFNSPLLVLEINYGLNSLLYACQECL